MLSRKLHALLKSRRPIREDAWRFVRNMEQNETLDELFGVLDEACAEQRGPRRCETCGFDFGLFVTPEMSVSGSLICTECQKKENEEKPRGQARCLSTRGELQFCEKGQGAAATIRLTSSLELPALRGKCPTNSLELGELPALRGKHSTNSMELGGKAVSFKRCMSDGNMLAVKRPESGDHRTASNQSTLPPSRASTASQASRTSEAVRRSLDLPPARSSDVVRRSLQMDLPKRSMRSEAQQPGHVRRVLTDMQDSSEYRRNKQISKMMMDELALM